MTEEVPVTRRDLFILAVVSIGGGLLIASWILSPTLSPQFISAVLVGTMMLSFFLFVPVIGSRLFIDD